MVVILSTITIGARKNLESENLEIDKTLVLDLYIKRLPHKLSNVTY